MNVFLHEHLYTKENRILSHHICTFVFVFNLSFFLNIDCTLLRKVKEIKETNVMF